MPVTFGSLFSGIGGIDLGFERAGMECRWQCEINPYANRVLKKHWPGVKRYLDIRQMRHFIEDVDVIAGGFPCKNTSTAAAVHGGRLGLHGPESSLWYDMLRIVRLVRPKCVVVENVRGAATWSTKIKGDLEDVRYRVSQYPWRLSSKDAGAPHLRERLFWIAHSHESGLPEPRGEGPCQVERDAWRAINRDAGLSSLAGVVRVDDGVPGGMDRRQRIERIGNAVDPRVSELIGRRILELLST
jgi:DNA (cytosine-5)-methyltransferase 1